MALNVCCFIRYFTYPSQKLLTLIRKSTRVALTDDHLNPIGISGEMLKPDYLQILLFADFRVRI
jgi:hypothetical protein